MAARAGRHGVGRNIPAAGRSPHWDIAEHGVGRWVRRSDIAAAIARRHLRDLTDLHDGPAAAWLDRGIPGALGLLCVAAELDGTEALSALLARGADRVNEALATVDAPVTRIEVAHSDGWINDYLPLAALGWVAQQTASDLEALFAAIHQGEDARSVLRQRLGAEAAEHWFGAPWAVDLHVSEHGIRREHWHWQHGGWQPAPPDSAAQVWQIHAGQWTQVPATTASMTHVPYLDPWPGFEREVGDNRIQ